MAYALVIVTGLALIKLGGNQLTEEGISALKEVAARNTKLTYVFAS